MSELKQFVVEDFEVEKVKELHGAKTLLEALFLSGEDQYIYEYIKAKSDFSTYFEQISLKYFKEAGEYELNFTTKVLSSKSSTMFNFKSI